MRLKHPSDYDYKRFRIRGPGVNTCLSVSLETYARWVRCASSVALESLVRGIALELIADGYTGTLSAAVRARVEEVLAAE